MKFNHKIKPIFFSSVIAVALLGAIPTPGQAQILNSIAGNTNALNQLFEQLNNQLNSWGGYLNQILSSKLQPLSESLGSDLDSAISQVMGAVGLPDPIASRKQVEKVASSSGSLVNQTELATNEVDRQITRAAVDSTLSQSGQERIQQQASATQGSVDLVGQQAQAAQVLSACTLQLRDIINQVNQGILTAQVGDLQLQEAYQQVVGQVGEQTAINALRSQCANIADPQQQQDCINQAAQQSGQLNNGQQSNDPFNIGQQFQNTISTIFAAAARGWLIAFGIAFQWLVEVSLLLTALLGPLAVGGSLLPVGQKAIFAWLTGFFSVGMVKLCFNIIAGLVASLIVNAGSVDSTIIAFAVGLLSPILAMALAAGGGMAIFSSLSNIATSGLGGLSRFLPRPDKFF
ncbi:hypothetical protein [Allocoleopsis franciscana]|uniref:Uncharacterized protein n=1 Tax=Allocoleopsis franciscana PCC 7113 TaxID=1173027 RepID=K9WQA3_9CYAN|nr:hypothetical protein [Allocoleopsis franciscana]AFZ21981.1 hypothetical protein Mic7113_6399 [Allocoleopsis franciscana PCC 7113]